MINIESYEELASKALKNDPVNGLDKLHDRILQINNSYASCDHINYSKYESTFCCIGCNEIFPIAAAKLIRVKNKLHIWRRCTQCRNKLIYKNKCKYRSTSKGKQQRKRENAKSKIKNNGKS